MVFTEDKIKEYKSKHGDIYLVTVEDKNCILRKPSRQDLSYVSAIKDPIQMSEMMLNTLWVDGDEDIKTDDELFMAVVSKMDVILKVKEAEVKKL